MEDTPNDIPPADATQPPAQPPAQPPGIDPRRRLRELLSVPESQRTDAQWDEIIELEIQTAPGNRISPQQRQDQGSHESRGQQPGWKRPGGKPQGKQKKPQRKPGGDRQQGNKT